MAEPSLDYELIEEVKRILLVDSPESLGKVDEKFIEKKDDPAKLVDISVFEIPHRPPIKFEPLLAGPEYVVLDNDRDTTLTFHDASLEMENQRAMEFCEAPTLEFEEKDSTDKHGTIIFEIPCSFNFSPKLIMLSAPCTHEDYNHLKVLFRKIFRRLVIDVYVYRKYCRFCVALLH